MSEENDVISAGLNDLYCKAGPPVAMGIAENDPLVRGGAIVAGIVAGTQFYMTHRIGQGWAKSKNAIDGAYCINSSNGYLVLCDMWEVDGDIEYHPVKELPEIGQESVKPDGSP